MSEEKRIIEALLFAAEEPLSAQRIDEHLTQAGHSGADIGKILKELQSEYEARGVNLVRMDNMWAFRTAQDLAGSLLLEKEVTKKMSRAALETMSIIAYHQPVTRAEIENIRGVATHKGTLDTLMEMGWVKPGRRRETPGRPLTWVTTTDFLDHFSLEALTDLPGLDDLKATGLLDRRPAIETLGHADDLFSEDLEDAIEEEQDLAQI